jgi:hypothetical protein
MGIFGGAPKTPSPEELKAQADAAARKARDEMATDKAGTEAAMAKQMQERETTARQFASTVIEDEDSKKKFLKGI